MNEIELFLKDPYNYIENAKLKDLIDLAKKADSSYYNEKYQQPIMTDDEYDMIIDRIKILSPNNKYLTKTKVSMQEIDIKYKKKLPYKMGSMDKLRPENIDILNKFIKKYDGPWIVSDKLDGISALYVIKSNEKKLYTRGDGITGTDISNLLELININLDIKIDCAIRGELIISKENFKKYKEMANARNMVAGIVNSKKINKNNAKDIDFIAYELIDPWEPSYINQFKQLKKLKSNIVDHTVINKLNMTILSDMLKNTKINSNYECDGIILSYNNPKQRVEEGNPDYAFAFKNIEELEKAIVNVKMVEWNVSKDGYIIPKLILEPTKLSGVIINSVTAFNAKYILDNSIGKGTIIKLIRSGDVIPHILEIIKKSDKPQMPNIPYEWNKSGINIITKSNSRQQKIKELSFFCEKLDINNISEGIIEKFIDANIDSIPKILSIKKSDLTNVSNFKDKMINKIYDNIHYTIQNITLLDFMTASNIFGHGISYKKIKKILDNYPDILLLYIENSKKIMIDKIVNINGFDYITAKQFVKNLPIFLHLLNKIPLDIQNRLITNINNNNDNNNNNKFTNLIIVFSGFRNKEWEKIIENNGGEINNTISKNTSLLVSTKEDILKNTNTKIINAKKLNINILNKEEFYDQYINI
jgi:DNA ligase (NAD+)